MTSDVKQMSPSFALRVALEFRPREMAWTAYEATISGWEWEYCLNRPVWFSRKLRGTVPDPKMVLRLCSRSGDRTGSTTVSLWDLPPSLQRRCMRLNQRAAMPEWEKRSSFPILLAVSSRPHSEDLADPYEMRQEFFALNGDLDQLMAFACKWGLWDSAKLVILYGEQIVEEEGGTRISRLADSEFSAAPAVSTAAQVEIPCIFPHQVWQKQSEYRKAHCAAPEKWLSHPDKRIYIVQRSQKPYFFAGTDLNARTEGCRDAIAATITLDHLMGLRFRICPRPGCNKMFEPEYGRKHCSNECAHVMAQRAYRERRVDAGPQRKKKGG
jgi:hypothetical protein